MLRPQLPQDPVSRFNDKVIENALKAVPPTTISQLIQHCGSQRLMFKAYWKNEMPACWERLVEDSYPPEIRIGMKPIA